MNEGIAAPLGFRFGVSEAGIKYCNRKDVGLIVSNTPASCAAVFTRNAFTAAPVVVSREKLHQAAGIVSGVVVNSGCANAATGDEGMANANRMAAIAEETTASGGPFLVCSTGTIGVQLPMEKLEAAIPAAASNLQVSSEAFIGFADAILTTDTVRKTASRTFEVDGKKVSIAGCAKGSGMMQPNMATMLAYVITDAAVEPLFLQQIFSRLIDKTINCVTVDGDTSTNDTAIIMANGASGVQVAADTPELHPFETALEEVLTELSRKLARDGEGATHLVEITVAGAPTFAEARKAALSVGNSPLVKTAIYGKDANWGRIACALGYSGVEFDANKVDIRIRDLELMASGTPIVFDEDRALEILSEEEIKIFVDLKAGTKTATVWTCDLTEKYIEINGSYRT